MFLQDYPVVPEKTLYEFPLSPAAEFIDLSCLIIIEVIAY